MKTVKVVTTKPELNEAEYAIYQDGVLIRHGERIDFDPASLSDGDQQTLGNARALLMALAVLDATAKNLI